MSEPSPYTQRFATGSIVLAAVSGTLSFLYLWGTEETIIIATLCSGALAGLIAITVTLYLLIRRRKISTRIYVALVLGLAAFGLCYFTMLEWVSSFFPTFDFLATGG